MPLQGFANAWPVEPGCTDVAFAWAPNRLLLPAYLVSLVTCLGLVALLVRRRLRFAGAAPTDVPSDAPRPWPLRKALVAGVVAALALGFVFALRAGVVLGPLVALVLWRGIGARQLALAAGALLAVVVPVLYLAVPVRDPGGFNTNLAVERIAAHWVGVAAVVLLGAALLRTLVAARRRATIAP